MKLLRYLCKCDRTVIITAETAEEKKRKMSTVAEFCSLQVVKILKLRSFLIVMVGRYFTRNARI